MLTCNNNNNNNDPSPSRCRIAAAGQWVSFLYASGEAVSATLQDQCAFSAPTVCAGLVYLVLCVSNLLPLIWVRRRNIDHNTAEDQQQQQQCYKYTFLGCIPLETSSWAYFVMGLLDLEAFYLIVAAFRYTTLTSVTVLGYVAIPSVLVCSRVLLKRRYTLTHLVGAAVCLTGVGLNVWLDTVEQQENDTTIILIQYDDKWKGDLLALLGGATFGLNDVICEMAVQRGTTQEYLGMVALFATILALGQAAWLERDQLQQLWSLFWGNKDGDASTDQATCSAGKNTALLLAFVAINSCSYYSSVNFLQVSESALLTLSTLTENFWAMLFSVAVQHVRPPTLFYAAVVLSVGGVCLYETAPSPMAAVEQPQEEGDDDDDDLEMMRVKRKGDYYQKASTREDDDDPDETNSTVSISEIDGSYSGDSLFLLDGEEDE